MPMRTSVGFWPASRCFRLIDGQPRVRPDAGRPPWRGRSNRRTGRCAGPGGRPRAARLSRLASARSSSPALRSSSRAASSRRTPPSSVSTACTLRASSVAYSSGRVSAPPSLLPATSANRRSACGVRHGSAPASASARPRQDGGEARSWRAVTACPDSQVKLVTSTPGPNSSGPIAPRSPAARVCAAPTTRDAAAASSTAKGRRAGEQVDALACPAPVSSMAAGQVG